MGSADAGNDTGEADRSCSMLGCPAVVVSVRLLVSAPVVSAAYPFLCCNVFSRASLSLMAVFDALLLATVVLWLLPAVPTSSGAAL